VSTRSAGVFGYWIDVAQVRGDETFLALESDPESARRSVVAVRADRQVRGWGIDLGATWIAPSPLGQRFTLGYARGSGDPNPADGDERAFRQTGLNGNSVGFGGVQSFAGYGVLLDPELANLEILTLGIGMSPADRTSLDLVWHAYRLVELAESLRDTRLASTLTGSDRNVGQALDVILAVEEWDRVELELSISALRAGEAVGTEHGKWTYGSFASVRLAF
jgi:alginate production protein